MSNLKVEFINSLYQNIMLLDEKNNASTYLVKHQHTGQLYVKKTMHLSKAAIYNHLRQHPHPNIVAVREVFTTEELCITIEDYISGKNITALLMENGPLAEHIAANYIAQICKALHHLHTLNIIHRDLQPNNIIVSVDGIVKLIDFDISRSPRKNSSKDTTILGTVGYAAPEQFGFSQTDARADIYSLGVLINVLLTGKLPNEYLSESTVFRNIILKCIQIDARNRYPSAAHILPLLPVHRLPAPTHTRPPLLSGNSGTPISSDSFGLRLKAKYLADRELYKLKPDTSKAMRALRSIPGFRSGFPWKIVTAFLLYPLILLTIYVMIDPYPQYGFWATSGGVIGVIITVIIPFILITNFLNIDSIIPLIRSFRKPQSRAICIGLAVVLSIAGIFWFVFIDQCLGISP